MNISRYFGKAGLKIKQHSPEILLGVGLVGMVTSTVFACKATVKVIDIVKERDELLETIDKVSATKSKEEYSEEDKANDIRIVNVQTAVKITKAYAPAAGIMTLSIFCIIASKCIESKRVAGLMAGYELLKEDFERYRNKVQERYGEDIEKEIRFSSTKEVAELESSDKDGDANKDEQPKRVPVGTYARLYDCGTKGWSPDPMWSRANIVHSQNWCNDRYHSRGYMFLNEVLHDLGMPECPAGQVVGWIYDEKHPDDIDFGLYTPQNKDFLEGFENCAWLDFNVHGDIVHKVFNRTK